MTAEELRSLAAAIGETQYPAIRGATDEQRQQAAKLLHKHVSKGDPIDVANFAMMLWCRGGRTTPPAQDDYPPRMKREDDCMTLQDWRIRAMNLEASWANCSQACARIQGQRDEALEMLRSLAMAIERRQSLVGSPAWKQAHETFLDAMERARAMLAKRGKT